MKTKYLLIGVFTWVSVTLQAQEFGFGLRGGINTYSIGEIITVGSNGPNGPEAGLVFDPVKDVGYQFGGYFVAQFGKFYLRPELNYMSFENHYDFPDKQSRWSRSKIDFPILLGYDILEPVSIYAGPDFGFFSDATIEGVQGTSFTTGNVGPDLEKTSVNLALGVIFRFKSIGIDLRYELGLAETAEEREDFIRSEYGVNLADLKAYNPNIFSLSVFIDVFRTDSGDIGNFFSGLFKNNSCYCPYNK